MNRLKKLTSNGNFEDHQIPVQKIVLNVGKPVQLSGTTKQKDIATVIAALDKALSENHWYPAY